VQPKLEHIGPRVGEPARKLAIGWTHASVGWPHFVKCDNHVKGPALRLEAITLPLYELQALGQEKFIKSQICAE
jgi:hypothetical protein